MSIVVSGGLKLGAITPYSYKTYGSDRNQEVQAGLSRNGPAGWWACSSKVGGYAGEKDLPDLYLLGRTPVDQVYDSSWYDALPIPAKL